MTLKLKVLYESGQIFIVLVLPGGTEKARYQLKKKDAALLVRAAAALLNKF